MSFVAKSEPYVEISAIVTRADGTIEDLGVISKSEKCGKGFYMNIKNRIKTLIKKLCKACENKIIVI
jgi:hypothetical protein